MRDRAWERGAWEKKAIRRGLKNFQPSTFNSQLLLAVTLFGKQIAPADLALACAGVLGAVCFFWLLPVQHPGSAADYGLDEEEAAEAARRWVAANGFALPDDAERRVYPHKNAALLDALQAEVSRPQTVRLLKGAAGARLPGHHWHVRWQDSGEELGDDQQREVNVTLNRDGTVYDVHSERAGRWLRPDDAVNRSALRTALREGTEPHAGDKAGENAELLGNAPDSLLGRYVRFDLSKSKTSLDPSAKDTLVTALRERIGDGANEVRVPSLRRRAAVRMARYHLRQTALRNYTFRLDTAYTSQRADLQTATVRFWGSAFHGQRPRVTVELTAGGALVSLNTTFDHDGLPARLAGDTPEGPFYQPSAENEGSPTEETSEEPQSESSDVMIGVSSDTGAGIVTGVLFVLLAGASIFLFVQRMNARVVDLQSALRDGLWGGLFAGGMLAMVMGVAVFQDMSFWMALLGFSVSVVFTAGGGAFVIFLASGAMDSLARAEWPEKVEALTLLRHGALRNVPVGASLLRGTAATFALVGATTLLLGLFPQATLDFSAMSEVPPPHAVLSYFGYFFGATAWTAEFVGLTVLLGLGTWLHRRRATAWCVVPGLTGAFVLLQICVTDIAPLGFHALFTAAFGAGLAWLFWRYDFMAAFTALLFVPLLWATAGGWMNAGSPLALDATLALASVGGVLVLGLVGALSGRTSTEVPSYTPSYIEELAERERLERDIEIAEEVQRSFLPRQMPQVEGLDLAALCLPAREVGGDYYDFIELPGGRLGVAIGDVSGKGIEASFYMTLVKGFLQTLADEERPPAEVLRHLNALFRRNAPRGTFVTMIYGVVDPAAGTFRFARAGHNPLAHCRSQGGGPQATDGGGHASENGKRPAAPTHDLRSTNHEPRKTHLLRPRGMAIGLADGPAFDEALEEVTLPLGPGDALLLYTDGLPEARNAEGREFGEERVRKRLQQHGARPAQQLLQTLADDVHSFVEAAGRHDDMTMLVVKRNQPSAVGAQPSASQAAKQTTTDG